MDPNNTATQAVEVLFNGPALAGIGATTDAGLVPSKFHVLPWDPVRKSVINIEEVNGEVTYDIIGDGCNRTLPVGEALAYAQYNVDVIFGIDTFLADINAMTEAEKEILRRDLIAITFLMTAYGYYDGECRKSTIDEHTAAVNVAFTEEQYGSILNTEVINRAATFILARMHTKYQTNHVLGGSPMQASMASSVRAFYSVSASGSGDVATKAKLKAYATCLHWALHPANERLLIPAVINNSKITTALGHYEGPEVVAMSKEEYFTIRANTPPASTHHFYVAAAAVQHLEPLGILSYLPTISQMKDIQTGWLLIEAQGARLHPAARHWGLQRVTANQKIVEPVCADLGYAIKKLMPMSSLAESPILKKEDSLNATWKKFIDALRAAMDQHGETMLDGKILEDIKASIMPSKRDDRLVLSVKKLLIQKMGDDDELQEEQEHRGRDESRDPPGPPPRDDDSDSDNDNAPGPSGTRMKRSRTRRSPSRPKSAKRSKTPAHSPKDDDGKGSKSEKKKTRSKSRPASGKEKETFREQKREKSRVRRSVSKSPGDVDQGDKQST